ncbi:alpha/beta-hydrolase [Tothia fuscella]|uniref:Alpha/beta-hydrolase n=1 Tax=Tothia fuscella TaxID=1048955 RepID=A0A9P4NLW3_9PEZI|nr:alpha/beta-hydrolase [Tothia fuscella]
MILGQISYLDCIVFLVFLTPQLLLHAGFFRTAFWLLGALPSLPVPAVIRLPIQFFYERYLTPRRKQSPFVQNATAFQDIVIRCVRFAFAKMPAFLGRVFFSKGVSLPFLRWRMLRHGYLTSPLPWREVQTKDFKGIWISQDHDKRPDIVIYYCHGGGFSMGSSYFYMEFLIAWVQLLRESGFQNPAFFSLEYTLVPDSAYPKQLHETFAGYQHVLSTVGESSRICVGGDSAGATLMLSLLLHLADHNSYRNRLPGMGIMISPWVTIVSENNQNTESDYLDANSLETYGRQYLGLKVSEDDPLASPGKCKDLTKWLRASPTRGWTFLYGSEEVLAPETRDLIAMLKKAGASLEVYEELGSIHAWPVVSLYLGQTRNERLHGLQDIVRSIGKKMR